MRSMMRLALASGAALAALAATATAASGQTPPPRLTLFGTEGFSGAPVTLTRDVSNLQSVAAAGGFDGTANDFARSLRAQGRWLVCMDAGFRTGCREVSGDVADLGEDGGSISSARYLGPAPVAAATGGRTAATTTGQPGAPNASGGSANMSAPVWRPLYRTDMPGGDYREIVYSRPGSTWQTCAAACDADNQCRAFTYVEPGRTEHGECYLKDVVPPAGESGCCTSGVKADKAVAAAGPAGAASPAQTARRSGAEPARAGSQPRRDSAADRIAREAADEAERRAAEEARRGVNRAADQILRRN